MLDIIYDSNDSIIKLVVFSRSFVKSTSYDLSV